MTREEWQWERRSDHFASNHGLGPLGKLHVGVGSMLCRSPRQD